jgi:hypothetical protein
LKRVLINEATRGVIKTTAVFVTPILAGVVVEMTGALGVIVTKMREYQVCPEGERP